MSRKRQNRVAPTLSDKQRRVVAVTTEHVEPGGVYRVAVQHDPDCPTLKTQSLLDCRCDPIVTPPERVA